MAEQRLIDANALKAKAFGKRGGLIHTADIDAMPTIEERKTEEWVERNPQNSSDCRLIECSECGNAYIVGYNIDYDDWINGRNFCIKCGARMAQEGEDNDG